MFLHHSSNAIRSLRPASSVPPASDRRQAAVKCRVQFCSHREAAPRPEASVVPPCPGCVGGKRRLTGICRRRRRLTGPSVGHGEQRQPRWLLKGLQKLKAIERVYDNCKNAWVQLVCCETVKKEPPKLGVSQGSRSSATQPNRLLELFSWKSRPCCFGHLY